MSDLATAPSAPATSNGHGPRMPRHEHWLKVPDYEAAGFEVLGWTNYTQATLLDLDSGETERYQAAIRSLVRGCRTVTKDATYESWFDPDGVPLPTPDAPDFLTKVPTELLGMALNVIRWEGPHLAGALFLARLIDARRSSG